MFFFCYAIRYRPNYLVYVNTLLFYRVGGTTRTSGILLALATFALLVVGTEPIGYIRTSFSYPGFLPIFALAHEHPFGFVHEYSPAHIAIMLVGALIFVLGLDLIKEALWDTRRRVSMTEYLTIASIMVCMTLWDFVIGVLFGIVVCCEFAAVYSQFFSLC